MDIVRGLFGSVALCCWWWTSVVWTGYMEAGTLTLHGGSAALIVMGIFLFSFSKVEGYGIYFRDVGGSTTEGQTLQNKVELRQESVFFQTLINEDVWKNLTLTAGRCSGLIGEWVNLISFCAFTYLLYMYVHPILSTMSSNYTGTYGETDERMTSYAHTYLRTD